MLTGTLSRVMAGCFALSAFAVAIVAGLSAANPATEILSRALIAMILCYPVGYVVGMICERIVADRLREHERDNPLPSSDSDAVQTSHEPQPEQSEEVIEV